MASRPVDFSSPVTKCIKLYGTFHRSTQGCYILVGKDSGAEFEDSAFTPLRGYLVEKYHFDDGMSEPSEAVNVIRRELSMLQDLVCINIILAHRIKTSEILPGDRKSYITHVILPRLSRENYSKHMYWNSHAWSSSDVIVMLK